jgi:hypothetical protein
MTVMHNVNGTSNSSFKIHKAGPTLFQGTATPTGGSDGDLYIRTGTGTSELYQRDNGVWVILGSGSSGEDLIGTANSTIIVDGIESGAAAANYFEISNALTGIDPKIEVVGTDPNIGIDLGVKGTGALSITGSSGNAKIDLTGANNTLEIVGSGGNGAIDVSSAGNAFSIIGTGEFVVVAGTTAQRPASPTNGAIRYNTTNSNFDIRQASAWQNIAIIDSPTFTGIPAAPTAATGTDTTQLATTAFVQLELGGGGSSTLAGLTDTAITTPADAALLIYDTGTATWRDFAVSGDILISDVGVVTIQANSVALGTDTTGNYVATITGTTNEIEVSGSGSETAGVTIGLPNDVTITGNLTVNGTTTTVNSTTVTIDDPVFTLGGDTPPASDDSKDRGIEFRYFDTAARIGFFGYDDSTNRFTAMGIATNTNEVFSGTTLDAEFGTVFAALSGNATTATTWATGRTITLTGDVTGVSGSFDGSGNLSFATTIATNSVALGTDTTGPYVQQGATAGSGLSGSVNVEAGTFTVTSNATNLNTASTLVFRDASGNFSAGTITAALTGNATTATTWATGRTITLTGDVTGVSGSFDGSGNLSFATVVGDNSHNHTSLTGITSLAFAADGSDSASISTTIAGSLTYFDFNLTDDNNQELWRWRFTPSGSTVYSAMELDPVANGSANLIVSGNLYANTSQRVFADDYHPNADTWTTGRTITLTGDVTGVSGSFDGSGNLSFATTIAANSVALGTDTTGNYVATITGTTNEIEVSGSGSETAGVTIGLPNAVTISGAMTAGSFIGDGSGLTNVNAVAIAPPGSPVLGDFWYNSETGGLFIYYTDITPDSYWVQVGGADGAGTAGSSGASPFVDTGTYVYYGGPRNVGIGTATPTEALHVIGNILASEDVTAYSDESLKTDISTISGALNIVTQLRGVNYTKKSTQRVSIGVIAQEVQKILPSVVHVDPETGLLSVAYGNMVGVLIEAIKEQQDEIVELKQQMSNMMKRLDKLDGGN